MKTNTTSRRSFLQTSAATLSALAAGSARQEREGVDFRSADGVFYYLRPAHSAEALFFASVVVSKFATLRYRSPSELRNQNDTRNQYVASVLSIPKFAKRRYRDVANFGIGTLEHRAF